MSTTNPIETMIEPWDDIDPGSALDRAPRGAASIVPSSSIAGRSLAAVVAIMTFLAALTTGAAMLVVSTANDWQADVGREVTVQVRPAAGRDIEADVEQSRRHRARRPRHRRCPRLFERGIRKAGRAVARRRPAPRRSADPAHDRRQARARRDAEFCRAAPGAGEPGADREPRRSSRLDGADAHHGRHGGDMRAGGARSRRRRDHAFGHLCHARRHGDQPADRRSAALCRRHRQLCRQPIPAPFSPARAQGRRHRRRRGDRACSVAPKRRAPGSPARPAATRQRRCSAVFPSASKAMWPSSSRSSSWPW